MRNDAVNDKLVLCNYCGQRSKFSEVFCPNSEAKLINRSKGAEPVLKKDETALVLNH